MPVQQILLLKELPVPAKPNDARTVPVKARTKPVTVILLAMVVILLSSFTCWSSTSKTGGKQTNQTEILWDKWGVPHIYAPDAEALFYAFGWSQAANHGDLLLRLYGESRGRAAEYWGDGHLESDILVHTVDIPRRAQQWYNMQDPAFKKNLDAFAAGINDYARAHPGKISKDVKAVLPVSGKDTLTHAQRLFHLYFMSMDLPFNVQKWQAPGSNAWAIAPSRSAGGHALLLANPHLVWKGIFRLFEAHLNCPGMNVYGATPVGVPTLTIGFNQYLGWTHTVNVVDCMDLYQLTLEKEGYMLDGKLHKFETRKHRLKIRRPDGSLTSKTITIRKSELGPVIREKSKDKKALALRVPGLDISPTPYTWDQYWDMMRATDFQQFETAIKRLQQPYFNIIYADRGGHIFYLCGGRIPVRPLGDWSYWQGIIPGDTTKSLWTRTFAYKELPKVKDPANGWIQNANDPPWSCTFPNILKPGDFPPYFSYRQVYTRPQRSINMLMADNKISLDEMIEYKHSTRLVVADRVLDGLIPAVRKYGDPIAKKAADVLEKWDRCTDNNSKGAVLFIAWLRKVRGKLFARLWDESRPLSTPDGIKNPKALVAALAEAARQVEKNYGAIDIAWGKLNRFREGGKDFPANGGPGAYGVFRVVYFAQGKDYNTATFGDTYVAAVEFSNPVKAKVLLGYGNATQPHSPHRGDQLELMSKKQLRPALLTRKAIEKQLKRKEKIAIHK